MRMYDLIVKKKHGLELTKEEIDFIIENYTSGEIKDYQMSAFLMTVCFNGMNKEETCNLTMAMANSGDRLDLSAIDGIKVDKHSTGGVGDKTSLVVGPMVAACGVPVAKMSGRGLGHTGGTIDKLESFKGLSTNIPTEEFIDNVNRIKMAIAGQTANLAPADKKIYALRDVTATVDNISLIASSIMSKKLASGADAIVLDVKTGSGAFMKKEKDAIELARTMVEIGIGANKDTIAIISDMDEPLGFAIGNALEVKEAIETLNGGGSANLLELSYILGSYMLVEGKIAKDVDEARSMLVKTIADKTALAKFAEFVKAQGGDESAVYDTTKLPQASIVMNIVSNESGFVDKINCEDIGRASLTLGGGREDKDSIIDLSVGIVLHKKVGDKVAIEDVIATVYANDIEKLKEASNIVMNSYTFVDTPVEKNKLVKWIITKDGTSKY